MKTITNFIKKFNTFEWAILLIVIGTHLVIAFAGEHTFSRNWFTRDDAYYYFKVAQNISEGFGSTFDRINPTNGYHPLWMLICIPIFALARFDLILPLRVLVVVMGILSAASAILMYRLLARHLLKGIAILAAAYWAFDTTIHAIVYQNGMETGITTLSILVFLTLLQNFELKHHTEKIQPKELIKLGIAATLVLFSRLDTIYLVAIVGIWLTFRKTPMRYLLLVELFTALSLIVLAYIQRSGLKIYLLAYGDTAVFLGCLAFIIQLISYYFLGLYSHPKTLSLPQLIFKSLIASLITSLALGIIGYALDFAKFIIFPRAVPFLFFGGLLASSLFIRLMLRFFSNNNQPLAFSPLPFFRQNWLLWLKDAVAYYAPILISLLAYFAINYFNFGTPMPVSGQIKRWWGSLANDVYGGGANTIADIFGIDPLFSHAWLFITQPLHQLAEAIAYYFHWRKPETTYWQIFGLFILFYLILYYLNRKKSNSFVISSGIALLLISAELQIFAYGALGYAAAHEWYWTLSMLATTFLMAHLIHMLIQRLPFALQNTKTISEFLALGLTAYFAYTFSSTLIARMPWTDPYENQSYVDMQPLIEDYTEPGSLVGMTGGGNVGYFIQDRTIVNLDGLINSYPYYLAQKEGQGGEYLAAMGLDYIFANPFILQETAPYLTNLKGRIEIIPNLPLYGRKQLVRFLKTPINTP